MISMTTGYRSTCGSICGCQGISYRWRTWRGISRNGYFTLSWTLLDLGLALLASANMNHWFYSCTQITLKSLPNISETNYTYMVIDTANALGYLTR